MLTRFSTWYARLFIVLLAVWLIGFGWYAVPVFNEVQADSIQTAVRMANYQFENGVPVFTATGEPVKCNDFGQFDMTNCQTKIAYEIAECYKDRPERKATHFQFDGGFLKPARVIALDKNAEMLAIISGRVWQEGDGPDDVQGNCAWKAANKISDEQESRRKEVLWDGIWRLVKIFAIGTGAIVAFMSALIWVVRGRRSAEA